MGAILIRMSDTTYQVVRQTDGSFQVKLTKPGDLPRVAAGFGTLADANAWVARDRRLARIPEPWVPNAHRRLNRR
jgi:hypothetical protein